MSLRTLCWCRLDSAQVIQMFPDLVLSPPALTCHPALSSLLVRLPHHLSLLALGMQIIPEHL